MSFPMSPRLRRGIALCAVVLATGGLVLYRAEGVQAFPGDSTFAHVFDRPNAPLVPGKSSAVFHAPGAHGMVSLSHTHVLQNSTTQVFAEVNVVADASSASEQRAPLALAVVLDTSGSMEGEKIEEARRSVLRLIADMRDDDEISVVRYSDSAELLQPLVRVGAVRESLSARIKKLDAGGGTNIPSGLSAGLHALNDATRGRVRRVVLVSDGLDTTRAQAESVARDGFSAGVTVSSLGIGVDFDESYMGSLAQNGHGNFGFVKDGASLAKFLHRELEETASTTVENVKVRLHLNEGVRFVSATGADATQEGGDVVLALGSLFSGDQRRVIVELRTNLQVDDASIATQVTWRAVGAGADTTATAPQLTIRGTTDPSQVERGRDFAVLASATSVIASRRQVEASSAYAGGNVALATALTEQNEKELAAVKAVAPAAAAPRIAAQMGAYEDMKKGFAGVRPSSAEGRAAAKANTAKDLGNLGREATY